MADDSPRHPTAHAGDVPEDETASEFSGIGQDGSEIEIPMAEVSGLKRTHKTVLGVTVSTGIEIETVSNKVSMISWKIANSPPIAKRTPSALNQNFAFPFVASRDDAFNVLVASSKAAIQRA